MADAADSKSAGRETMGVRPSPRAPIETPLSQDFAATEAAGAPICSTRRLDFTLPIDTYSVTL